jgi:hypothetical protein
MKPAQVNKLYAKLTPQEQAALVFEAAARNDESTIDAVLSYVERKTYDCMHADYMQRIHGLLYLSGYYGGEFWKNRVLMLLACFKAERGGPDAEAMALQFLAKIVAMEHALAKTCTHLKVDVAAVKKMAGCASTDFIGDDLPDVDNELIEEYIDAFSTLARL